ncbi:TetR family transcriptional regulator [Saccharomonospora piscinae]|uniref:TetR family transcriptional regulator n=1 Tax=Saccharomonospora piscinae TaxID=687388 RepID=A0A1V9AD50_SACPI|nr:TetR family transcriptional regulator [Saccharomonospora piscinae]OQO95052.1 TetR family transcriptional regulator [Saccharomonospora piscinae]TLW90446.1 TetR/AcrR family transcriptional regulator [Saccharomonospora piscinae]
MTDPATTGRDRLLSRAIEHFADHGVTDHSVRGLASAIGTSHRMLIYHFGSREGLLAEVVTVMEQRERDTLAELEAQDLPLRDAVSRFWTVVSDAAQRYGPLFFELSSHAMQGQPHARTLRGSLIAPWLDTLTRILRRAGHSPDSARRHARLGLAVARGLLFDLLLSGDTAEVDDALHQFADLVLAPSAESTA